MAGLNVNRTDFLWALGKRIPRRGADAFATLAAPIASLGRLPAVDAWAESVARATGSAPTRSMRRRLIAHWIRNNLWSLSLERWSDAEIHRVADISDEHVERLRTSLAGPGLVLALPHMGSWDFAGAWCARIGIPVASVAERLPDGMYERFRADEIRAGKMVCLLADRDLSAHGIRVPWPESSETISVPAGPALLARRTGADLRVATTHFAGGRLGMTVSPTITGDTPEALMRGVVEQFAEGVRRHSDSWLMLREAFL